MTEIPMFETGGGGVLTRLRRSAAGGAPSAGGGEGPETGTNPSVQSSTPMVGRSLGSWSGAV